MALAGCVQAPESIRAQFGTNKTYNACHGSDAPDTAAEEVGQASVCTRARTRMHMLVAPP